MTYQTCIPLNVLYYAGYGTSSSRNSEPVRGENKNNFVVKCKTCIIQLGNLQLKTLIIRTKSVLNKWIELGMALDVPIEQLERINDEHRDNPFNGLVRVYQYWLADEHNLMPTWEKLVNALYEIYEYRLAASVVNAMVSL